MDEDRNEDQTGHTLHVSHDVHAARDLSRHSYRHRGASLFHMTAFVTPLSAQYEALGSYYEVLLVLLDALMCFVGLCLPGSWITKDKRRVLPLVLLRCLMIPIAFLIVRHLAYPSVIAFMVSVLGLSRGCAHIADDRVVGDGCL